MRLFTGIAIPPDVIHRISRLLDYLRPAAQIRWVPPYNLHLTMKFIGEWPEQRVNELIEALQSLRTAAPVEIRINGIGWLPNPHSPRVLFTGIQAGIELAAIAASMEDALAPLGIARENRAFKPHLTLARIKDSATPLGPLRQAIAKLESTDFGSFRAECFHLYLSKTGPSGSIYTQLAEIRFTG